MSDTETKSVEPVSVLSWGVKGSADYMETPFADVPANNLSILCLRGYRHILGNEVAAKVTAWKKSDEGKSAADDEIAAKAREFRAEFLDRIVNGQLGQRATSGAPRVTGIEAIRRAVTLEFAKKLLDGHSKRTGTKVSVPTGEDTITIGKNVYNREALLAATYKKFQSDIDAETDRRNNVAADAGDAEDLFAE